MYSEQERDYDSDILREKQIDSHTEHVINSRTYDAGNSNNFLQQNYGRAYLKCSKSEEFQFKIENYKNQNFKSYNTKIESEPMKFDSVKIENLRSNISITVNYENRQEHVLGQKNYCKITKDDQQNKHLKNIKIEENFTYADLQSQKDVNSQINTAPKDIFKNEYQTNPTIGNSQFLSSDVNTRNKMRNIVNVNDNFDCRNAIYMNNNVNNSINNYTRKHNINPCKDDNFYVNDNNNTYNNCNNQNVNQNAVYNVNNILNNQNFVQYQISNLNKTSTSSCMMPHKEMQKKYPHSTIQGDSTQNHAVQNVSDSHLNLLFDKYPDISFNLPECKVENVNCSTEHYTRLSSYKIDFPQLESDKTVVTILPKVIKNDKKKFRNIKKSDEKSKYVNTINHGSKFNKCEQVRDYKRSKVIQTNPNFSKISKPRSSDQFNISSSFPNNLIKPKTEVDNMYSQSCSQNNIVPPFNEYFGNDISNMRSYAVNKSNYSFNNVGTISENQNSSQLRGKYNDQSKNIQYTYINDVSSSTPVSTFNHGSLEYKQCLGESDSPLFMPPISGLNTLSSFVKYSKHDDLMNFRKECKKDTSEKKQEKSLPMKNNINLKHKFLPTELCSEQNSLKYTIRFNENEAKTCHKTNNLLKQNESIPRSNTKYLRRNEKMSETPNYKELLNKAYALKNTMSETDLNMEIIRRTLKCDVPLNTTNNSSKLESYKYNENETKKTNNTITMHKQMYGSNISLPLINNNDFIKKEVLSTDSILSSSSTGDIQETTEKYISPLDLSLKTIKTTADSTASFVEDLNFKSNGRNYIPVLPKIDFNPNFSIIPNKEIDKIEILDLSDKKIGNEKTKIKNEICCPLKNTSCNPKTDFHITSANKMNNKLINELKETKNTNKSYISSSTDKLSGNKVNPTKLLDNKVVDLNVKHRNIETCITEENNNDFNIVSKQATNQYLESTGLSTSVISKQLLDGVESLNINDMPKNKAVKIENLRSDIGANIKSNGILNLCSPTKSSKSFVNFQLKKPKISSTNTTSANKYSHKSSNSNNSSVITKVNSSPKIETKINDMQENKFDIDSTRIRTKAELKGFDLSLLHLNKNMPTEKTDNVLQSIDSNNVMEINMFDWNSKCDDFVTQLVSDFKSDKKSGRSNKKDTNSQKSKNFLDENCEFITKNIKRRPLNNQYANDCAKLYSSSDEDEDKPLNKLYKPNPKICSPSYKKNNPKTKTENEVKTVISNISHQSEEDKDNICIKSEINSNTEMEENINMENCIKNSIDKSKKASKQDVVNQQIPNSDQVETSEIKSRKRKLEDFTEIPLSQETDKSNINTNKYENVNDSIENKIKEKCPDISKKTNYLENYRNFKKIKLFQGENNKNIDTEQNSEKSAGCKESNTIKTTEPTRRKKRKHLFRNIEYNRILRNKRMITRGNLTKSLYTSTKSKNQLEEKKRTKNLKTIPEKSHKNQKPHPSSSSKKCKTCNKNIDITKIKCNKCDKLPSAKGKFFNNNLNVSRFPPGWEHEVFEYKKSLKIPLKLITIKGNREYITKSVSEDKKLAADLRNNYSKANQSDDISSPNSSTSIIDILHSRAITFRKEPKRISKNLAHKKAKGEKMYKLSNDNSKKTIVNHFSVFDTEILKARTRTESRMLKTKEHIREIFVGEDRFSPLSSESKVSQANKEQDKASLEEKFRQYLEEMNFDFGLKIRKSNKTEINKNINNIYLKNKDERCNQNLDNEDKLVIKTEIIENENTKKYVPDSLKHTESCQNRSTTMDKCKRQSKYRKKGSSGFDYIKKKKKTNVSTKPIHCFDKKEIFSNLFIKRSEVDVCKEIKTWVINKSLGQSYLHKAARLGYVDVIAYCLEKLNMNPNPKDNAGYTPLHEACQQGRIDIARLLLQYGANHSQAAHSGIRPLHEASETGCIEIIRLLLSYGADPLLTTYSGQTPLMLADTDEIEKFILNHIDDIQNNSRLKTNWSFLGPWKQFIADDVGYNELEDAPNYSGHFQKAKSISQLSRKIKFELLKAVNLNLDKQNNKSTNIRELVANTFCDNKLIEDEFQCEESDMPLPPLYILKDEGSVKWLLLSDLCHILKIKSKEKLLKQVMSSSASSSVGTKDILRELKISDFIEKSTCLQLLCAGEKLNIQGSKVVLIKYNDQVKNLLGVEKTVFNF